VALSVSLSVRIGQRGAGAFALDAGFATSYPWTVLFGPSGSGKTTLLRAIAGFMRPENGRIVIGQETVFDAEKNLFVAPHLRPVRYAPQAGLLFPHMTVEENVLYGCRQKEDSQMLRVVEQVLQAFGIASLKKRLPREISGGEARRVSVARALCSAVSLRSSSPPLLLLDEPFTGLDLEIRDALLTELKRWTEQAGISVLAVTHDVSEAFQLGAHVIRLKDGKVFAEGSAHVTLAAERQRILGQLRDEDQPPS
jgi:molybdate transport system ATP-binding protein